LDRIFTVTIRLRHEPPASRNDYVCMARVALWSLTRLKDA
jgi:hypothetical protein